MVIWTCLFTPSWAQEDEESGGFLVNLLEDNLSGDNLYIKVTGLDGALSSQATIEQLTIADDDGVWLTVKNAVLDWNRLALVRGRFSVNTLSASEIDIARKPTPTAAQDDLPAPEAGPFQLPELPVSIEIGELRVDKTILGETVVGRPAELSLSGALTLADGTLDTKLAITRLDRPTDELGLIAGFENETRLLSLDLKLAEDDGGLVSQILGIPDSPSLLLTAKGQGPLNDFTADLALASESVDRLTGQVRLRGVPVPGADENAPNGIGFEAELAGDVTPLLSPEYKEFFGQNTLFELDGQSDPDGRIAIPKFSLTSQALNLDGALEIAGSGQIKNVLLEGRISPPEGPEVVLPLSGERTAVQSVEVFANLDANENDKWNLRLALDGLSRTDMAISGVELTAEGTLDQTQGFRLIGDVSSSLRDVTFNDAALSQAIGQKLELNGEFELTDQTALKLSQFLITGDDYTASVDAEIDGLDSGFQVDGRAEVEASDLSRFSKLTGQELGGSMSATLMGRGSPLGGSFDFDLDVEARDITSGIAQVDDLLPGVTTATLEASRGEAGLEIHDLSLVGTALTANATGTARSSGTGLSFTAELDDLTRVVPQMSGPLKIVGNLAHSAIETSGTVRANGPDGSFADVKGQMSKDGDIDLAFDAALTRIEQFLPQFPGMVTAEGSAKHDGKTWQIAGNSRGPASISADVTGTLDQSEDLLVDVKLREPKDGPISQFLKIPGTPSLLLTAKGQGPLADFVADVTLASDDVERLAGQVRLGAVAAPEADEAAPRSLDFSADLKGNITPLLTTVYRDFFGNELALNLVGTSEPDGGLAIEEFDLLTEAMILNGAFDLAGSGLIERALFHGRIAPPDGSSVVLPLPGPRTTLQAGVVSVRLEPEKDDTWDVRLGIDGLDRPDLKMARAEATASGTIDQSDGLHLVGDLESVLRGLLFADTALTQAIGTQVRLKTDFDLMDMSRLDLMGLMLSGSDYSATADLRIDDLDANMKGSGTVDVNADDLSRFSGLADRPVGGAISASLSGSGTATAEVFDVEIDVTARDLKSGIETIDKVVTGQTKLTGSAARNASGLEIRDLRLNGTSLTASAAGTLRKGRTNLDIDAELKDLALLVPEVSGPLTLTGDVSENNSGLNGTARLDGPTESFVVLNGTLSPDQEILLDFDAALSKIERFLPEFPGTFKAKGTANRSGEIWQISSTAEGPAGIAAEIGGSFDQATSNSDVAAKGQVRLGAVNRFISPNSVRGTASFDLALKGKPELSSLSGTISTANTTVAIPAVAQTINDLDADITLSNNSANVSVSAGLGAGGQVVVSGPVELAAPFKSSLTVDIQQLVLTDNVSFDSSANGQLTYTGALAGAGAIAGEVLFGETNININAMSGSIGAAPIPPITHRREPSKVHATRQRAGLVDTGNGGAGPDIGLDIRLAANNKVFVRGRGLQAELGGEVLVRGSTANVAPSGQIGLVRGNLDILGRRLNLSKGLVSLQGKLEPYMEFAATTSTSDGVATLEITGPLSAPEINVFSQPERPSEEALAMLIFGNQYSELSPLKLAQMAASMAQLSGAGGGATEETRKGLGVDTLDVSADDDGKAQVGAGKYIADGVYTDFTVNTRGDTEVNLNLDVTETLTLKGTVDTTGDTAVGIFFERDY